MINYHVRKKKRTRYTFRLVGLAITIICVSQVVAFFMGYGRSHKIGTFFAFVFGLYGIYLLILIIYLLGLREEYWLQVQLMESN